LKHAHFSSRDLRLQQGLWVREFREFGVVTARSWFEPEAAQNLRRGYLNRAPSRLDILSNPRM